MFMTVDDDGGGGGGGGDGGADISVDTSRSGSSIQSSNRRCLLEQWL